MRSASTTLIASDGKRLHVRTWVPGSARVLGEGPAGAGSGGTPPRAVIQVVHGMAEHAGRYEGLARAACARGIAVVADDHRGHGGTIETADERGHTGDAPAWNQLLRDQETVRDAIVRTWPDAPVLLLGHSWGSLIVRGGLARCSTARVKGAIIMGTADDPGLPARLGIIAARAEARLRGPRHPSAVLESQVLAPYNRPFAPARTELDWLSRDEAEVNAYLADPLCGFMCSAGFYRDLLHGGVEVSSARSFAAIPAELPVLVTSGAEDPVGRAGRGVARVATRMRRAGVRDLTLRLYPGARHELLHETNRDEVVADLMAWVELHLPEGVGFV